MWNAAWGLELRVGRWETVRVVVVWRRTPCPTILPSSFRSVVTAHDLRRWFRFFSFIVGCSPLHVGAARASSSSVLGCPHLGCPERDHDMSEFHESLPSTGGKAQSFTPDSARRTSRPQVAHHVALV